jgi:RNAse (barnase) inhibitor barstar
LIETSGAANLDREAVGKKLADKALAWAVIAAKTELPLKVIFVNISTKARMQRFNYHIQRGLERVDEHLVKSHTKKKARESVFIADALDWFPFTLGISRGFTELEAYSTETRRYHSLLPADTKINPDADVVPNTLAALHIPPWIAN